MEVMEIDLINYDEVVVMKLSYTLFVAVAWLGVSVTARNCKRGSPYCGQTLLNIG